LRLPGCVTRGHHRGTAQRRERCCHDPFSPELHHGQRYETDGNKTADRNYREATQKFVNSAHGQAEIRGAGHLTADEERDAEAAEAKAKAHAKEFDPEEVRRDRK
jgi:hypothetical protein